VGVSVAPSGGGTPEHGCTQISDAVQKALPQCVSHWQVPQVRHWPVGWKQIAPYCRQGVSSVQETRLVGSEHACAWLASNGLIMASWGTD
jgi:hypothetical protein